MVSFTPQSLYPLGESPDTHGVGGWVEPTAGLGTMKAFIGYGTPAYNLTNAPSGLHIAWFRVETPTFRRNILAPSPGIRCARSEIGFDMSVAMNPRKKGSRNKVPAIERNTKEGRLLLKKH